MTCLRASFSSQPQIEKSAQELGTVPGERHVEGGIQIAG